MNLPYRQIHLDFHTSEHIPGVGSQFDPEQFAGTLQQACVNSVTCFARCHHGWLYYDSQKFPGRIHPQLANKNLLKEQIAACHARGIRVPVYVTVQWDQFTADQHPEWLALGPDGKILGTPPYEGGFYRYLCLNSPYVDFLKTLVQEILETFPVDGLFFDIVHILDDSSKWSRAGMKTLGMNPTDPLQRRLYGFHVVQTFKSQMSAFVRQINPDCSLFYNSGHFGPSLRQSIPDYTHLELESLASGNWGYMHFPLVARYARTLGVEIAGMGGKFHTTWGDFHSYKNPAALEYECFRMLAMNARCMVGDQLHPTGKINSSTYHLIGYVYSQVARKEPWCEDAQALSDIGLMAAEEFTPGAIPQADTGAARMLQELEMQFDRIDSYSDFSQYRVLVLPDQILVDARLAEKLSRYLAQGGALIASNQSGMNAQKNAFTLPEMGVEWLEPAPYEVDFIKAHGVLAKDLYPEEYTMYLTGASVQALPGSTLLAHWIKPYFNRTYEHFCSHFYTPSSGEIGGPAVIQNGKVIYFSHPIFTLYQQLTPRWVKTLFANALNILLPEPLVQIKGPSTLLSCLNSQAKENRWILHLLHYIAERRGDKYTFHGQTGIVDVVEDVIPLYFLPVSVRTDRPVGSIRCVPEGTGLEFTQEGDYTRFILPKLNGHQMIEIAFEKDFQ